MIDQNSLAKRGASLQNTEWCLALCVYTGHDTKIMLNTIRGKYKNSRMEKKLGKLIFRVLFLLLSFCAIAAYFYIFFYEIKAEQLDYLEITYLQLETYPMLSFLYRAVLWFLLLNGFLPISLIVTLEMIRFLQGFMIQRDQNMRTASTGETAIANASNLNDELGLVNFIFTDKTGTLTQNEMTLHSITIGVNSFVSQRGMQSEIKSNHFLHHLNY